MYGLSTQKSGRCREVDTVNQIHCKGGLYPGGGDLSSDVFFYLQLDGPTTGGRGRGLKAAVYRIRIC